MERRWSQSQLPKQDVSRIESNWETLTDLEKPGRRGRYILSLNLRTRRAIPAIDV